MKCLLAASEVAGFAKTGGLADVAGALPRALAAQQADCAIIMPLYTCVRNGVHPIEATPHELQISVGSKVVAGRICLSKLPNSNIPVFLIEQPDYFERDDVETGFSLYQYTEPNGETKDYSDNCERFVFFCRAILEAMPLLGFWPDILHLNDWHTGLTPVYLREIYARAESRTLRTKYQDIRTIFTIHNLAHQGNFWHLDMELTGLPWRLFHYEQLEYFGHLSFLKAGIVFSDFITTVSPTYAREIQTVYYGCGLQGVLAQNQKRLCGIVNGVDYSEWNPATDIHLPARYDEANLAGKAECKTFLQKRFGLKENPKTLLFGVVSRLVDQKLEIMMDAEEMLPSVFAHDVQFVVLGQGATEYHAFLKRLQADFPKQVAIKFGQDEKLAHQIEAGADVFVMPSKFEPCGLNQMYSLKYGTIPLVRATGGLADTVTDASPEDIVNGTATGFVFVGWSADAFVQTMKRAITMFQADAKSWRKIIATGMKQDWSWNKSARAYRDLYEKIRVS